MFLALTTWCSSCWVSWGDSIGSTSVCTSFALVFQDIFTASCALITDKFTLSTLPILAIKVVVGYLPQNYMKRWFAINAAADKIMYVAKFGREANVNFILASISCHKSLSRISDRSCWVRRTLDNIVCARFVLVIRGIFTQNEFRKRRSSQGKCKGLLWQNA